MPTIPPVPFNWGRDVPKFPVSTTGSKDVPLAPRAHGGWASLSGALATQLPTALQQARMFRRAALRALR